MRRFLSSSAGATFNQETPNVTINVRKECVELIFKLGRGKYAILNMIHNQHGGITLVSNWCVYFNRLRNPQAQLPMIERNCPTLFAVMQNEDKDKVYEIELDKAQTGEEKVHGFALNVDSGIETPLVAALTMEVLHASYTLLNKCTKIYRELCEKPPFPAWKDGLKDIWN